MQLMVAAVGRLKTGPDRELAERYRDRVAKVGRAIGFTALDVVEVRESPAQEAGRRVVEESIAVANVIPEAAAVVLLDRRGENLGSDALAGRLRAWRDNGCGSVCFLIGGAEGLGGALRDRADMVLAFGAATWPHQLVRIMLLEQIYRALTILAGHPYHRG
jgi:23S rRNA (pseudouridine1915-N3)-methyltransferase